MRSVCWCSHFGGQQAIADVAKAPKSSKAFLELSPPLNLKQEILPMSRLKPFIVLLSLTWVAAASAQSLPDFTGLVEQNAPAVVRITVTKGGGDETAANAAEGAPGQREMPEIFRRFFGDPRQFQHPDIQQTSLGSGFIISADGYVMTNHHVVADGDDIKVELKDRREFKARVIGSDEQSDVALLKLEASGLPTVKLGDSSKLKPGQWVIAIGSPFGMDYSVTAGIVSAIGRNLGDNQRYVPFIQNDVAINRGNSGGPLINLAGEVVGINSQIFSNTGGSIGVSFAIPMDYANKIVTQLKTKGKVARGYLGVSLQEVGGDSAHALGLPRVGGALVAQVNKATPAAKAGLKEQDVITSFNGQPIERSGDLPPMVGATVPGTRVQLGVFRNGKQIEVPLIVGELPGTLGGGSAATPSGPAQSGDALGIAVSELSNEQREQAGLDPNTGVLIEQVTGASARRAGLRPGDVLLMVGRNRIASVAQFKAAAAQVPKGQPVLLLVRSGDSNRFITLTADSK